MRVPRFYLKAKLIAGQTLTLSKEQAHYALTVLRLKDQRPVQVFDGKGIQADAILQVTGRRSANISIQSCQKTNTESPLNTVLLQGISKGDRMDYSIQKSVELGITTIQPLFTERSEVKLKDDKLVKKCQQWQDIAINACEQSGRNIVPNILPPLEFETWLKAADTAQGLVLDPYAQETLKTLSAPKNDYPYQLLIGPEGGLTEQEVLQAVTKGLTPIQLGPRVLRTETASVVILSALQTLWGDF